MADVESGDWRLSKAIMMRLVVAGMQRRLGDYWTGVSRRITNKSKECDSVTGLKIGMTMNVQVRGGERKKLAD